MKRNQVVLTNIDNKKQIIYFDNFDNVIDFVEYSSQTIQLKSITINFVDNKTKDNNVCIAREVLLNE